MMNISRIAQIETAGLAYVADNANVEAAKEANTAVKNHHSSLRNTVSRLVFLAVGIDGLSWDANLKDMFAKGAKLEKAKSPASDGRALYTYLAPYLTQGQRVTLEINEESHTFDSLASVADILEEIPVSSVKKGLDAWRKAMAERASVADDNEAARIIAYLEENPSDGKTPGTVDEIRAMGSAYTADIVGKGAVILADRAEREAEEQAKQSYEDAIDAAKTIIGEMVARGDVDNLLNVLKAAQDGRDALLAEMEKEAAKKTAKVKKVA